MKSVQIKYNLLQFFYFFSNCAILGFTALFLGSKGLNNSQIGFVTGLGALSTIVISPMISSIPNRFRHISVHTIIYIINLCMIVLYTILTWIRLTPFCTIFLYIFLFCLIQSIVPFLSNLCMDYVRQGYKINFGLARGLGSLSFAIAAIFIGIWIDRLNIKVCTLVFIVSTLAYSLMLFFLPKVKTLEKDAFSSSIFQMFLKYKKYTLLLIGISLPYGASCGIDTYLIHIVKDLGGASSLYGVMVFIMAASELPAMAFTQRLLKKFSSQTILMASIFFYLVRNGVVCLSSNFFLLTLGMLFQSLSYGLFTSTIAYYVADTLDIEDQLMGQTMASIATTGLGATIGNLCGGILSDFFGLKMMLAFYFLITLIGTLFVRITFYFFNTSNVASK